MKRLLLPMAVAALFAAVAPPVVSGAQTAPAPAARRLSLQGQSPYVGVGGEFVVRLRIDRTGLRVGSEVQVTVYRAVQTRSEFAQTAQDRISRIAAVAPVTFPMAALAPDANGDVTVRVAADLGADDGVFPVRVDLRDRNGILERFTTHLVYLTGSHTGPKLGLSLVLPVQAAMSLPHDAPRELTDLEDVVASIAALEGNRWLPFVLEPAPETVVALDASNDDRAKRALESLRRLAVDHQVVARPYVPLSLPALMQANLPEEIAAQVDRGTAAVTEALQIRPDTRTWVETEPLSPESIDELIRRGVERIVAAEPVLDPVPELNLTLSRPFVLAGREEDTPAVTADAGLSARFNNEPNQVLEAHHLLADLAVLWLDSPASDRRAVVAVAPPGWRATRGFMDALAAGLVAHPVVEPVTLDSVFTTVAPAVVGRGLALVRHPAPVPPGGLLDVAAEIRQSRKRLASLATVLNVPSPAMTLLEERLLIAESIQLPNTRARLDYVHAVEAGIADQLGAIEMPTGRSITLTARRGQIPVTFQNRTGSPAKVVVTVQSDKLEFPGGATRAIDLTRRNTTERFEVVARTSGAFPLRITLQSPDGNLMIGQARLTVRSTAASRVSVFVSFGAVAFLALWWGRHIVRGRRAGRLVPA
ncbi:MAG: DUF6049 family protein [Acidimicrobiales bacterium]